jgi:hypothetical protein
VLESGCSPISASQLYRAGVGVEERHDLLLETLTDQLGRQPTPSEVESTLRTTATRLERDRSPDVVTVEEVEGATVVSAEDVARYTAGLQGRRKLVDIVDVVVPPRDLMFLEFQRCPNRLDLYSWGVLISGKRLAAGEGWRIDAALVGEWQKGRPVGAMARWNLFLGEDAGSAPLTPTFTGRSPKAAITAAC